MAAAVVTGAPRLMEATTHVLWSAPLTRASETTTAPRASSRLMNSGSFSAALRAVLILSSAALGVPFGAYRPCQMDTLKPFTPASSIVGSLASAGVCRRLGVVTAKALILPASIWPVVFVVWSHMMSTWPPNRSFMAGAVPL